MRKINKSVETDSKETQMLELAGKDTKTVIVTRFPMIKT